MKIKYADSYLCDEGQKPRRLSISAARRVGVDALIGAAKARLSDRGNTLINAAFEIERVHKSEAEAEGFFLNHQAALSLSEPAHLIFECAAPRGQNPQTALLKNASLVKISGAFEGLKSVFAYEFTTSEMEV